VSCDALGELGTPPFIFLSSWDEFPVFLEKMKQKMVTNPSEIQQMQDDCIVWWESYKKYIAQKIARRIEGLN
jgi:hypothetical protein